MITCLQLHVTSVFELLDIVAPPKNSVTPSRNTALSTAGNSRNVSGQFTVSTQDSAAVLVLLTVRVMIRPEKTSFPTKFNQASKEEKVKLMTSWKKTPCVFNH